MNLGPYSLDSIHCGECSAMMAALPDDCIDLWITSPPYGEMRAYNGYTFDFEPIAKQLYRVTKPGGVGVWVVADETKNGSESGESFRQALGFMAMGFNLHDTMIWQASGVGAKGSNKAYWQAFEYMFVFSKATPKAINRIADVVNKNPGHQNTPTKSAVGRKRTGHATKTHSVRTNVWTYDTISIRWDVGSKHPGAFPEALARDHILSWSNPGEIVLDPMIGSGTSASAAQKTGRRWLGFDISQEYVELARRRVDLARVPLFVENEPVVIVKPEQAALFTVLE
jgi:DNA modification methylase